VVAFGLIAAACGSDSGDDASDDTVAGTAAETVDTATEETTAESAPADTTAESAPADTTADSTADSTAPGGDDEACTEERAGGDVVALTGSPYATLDPAQMLGTGGYGGDLAAALYGSLIYYNPDTAEFEPYIATSWEPNEDNSSWTVTIRDDVTFGNGEPFTTADIAAGIERQKLGRTRGARMANQVTAEVVDPTTIVLSSAQGFNLPFMLSADLGWIPNNNVVTTLGEGFARNALGAGAGAFEFESISDTPGESLVLVAKDDWWGGPVCIDRIEFKFVQDPTAGVESFTRGEADTMYLPNNAVLAPVDEAGLLEYSELVGAYQWVFTDQGKVSADSPFKDVRIREAMQLAIDYDVLYERVQGGIGPKPTSAVIPEGSPYYTGAEGPPYDPDRASELIAETIADGTWDGSFTFLIQPTPVQQEAAIVFEALWESVGMDVTVEPDPNALTRIVVEPNFEVSSLGFAITPPHPFTNLSNLYCDNPVNRTGYCDPAMDAALDELQAALTIDENAAALAKIQEIWNTTFPYAIWDHTEWGIGAQENVGGLRVGSDNVVYFDRAYLEQ